MVGLLLIVEESVLGWFDVSEDNCLAIEKPHEN